MGGAVHPTGRVVASGQLSAVPVRAAPVVRQLLGHGLLQVPPVPAAQVADPDQDVRQFRRDPLGLPARVIVQGRVPVPVALQGLGDLGVNQGQGLGDASLLLLPAFI